jgi:serine/threonine protein kinase/tetratricopeptide (TPR) repeat protein
VPETRFEIVRTLGEGGMGVVYEALDTRRGAIVALKHLRDMNPESLARFKREFRTLQDVHHPNLVTLGELVSDGDHWSFTMELVDGVDFVEYVRGPAKSGPKPDAAAYTPPPASPTLRMSERSLEAAPSTRVGRRTRSGEHRLQLLPFDEGRLRSALRQVALALAALHERGLVHRDVKPSNIRVTASGRVVVLDFGLVRDVDAQQSTEERVLGTPSYMAPEQATSSSVGPEADWYAVGVLLYEAMTGVLPFEGSSMQVLLQKQEKEPPPPSVRTPGIPEDLDKLCAALLCADPKKRPSRESVLRALDVRAPPEPAPLGAPVAHVPFLGRNAELDELHCAYLDSRQGAPVTVVVEGESGVGKSALVRAFIEALAVEEPELVVLAGRCFEHESVPYKAFDGVVDALALALARMPKAEAMLMLPTRPGPLVQVFPVLRRVQAIARLTREVPPQMDPLELRGRAFSALRDMFTRLGDQRPFVIAIDDMQWGDADSYALLEEVFRPPDAPSSLFIAIRRTGAAASSPKGGLPLHGDVRTIDLRRLSYAVSKQLAAILLERVAPGIPPSVAAAVAKEADGHPLFLDALVAQGTAAAATGRPTRLDDLFWSSIERLEESERGVMELLAVAGAPIPRDVLVAASGLGPADLERHLAKLRNLRLVQTEGLRGRDRVEAYHDRLRAAVLARLSAERRVDLHRCIAVAFETAGYQDLEVLARHWLGAGDDGQGARYTVLAAREATRALAFDRAAKLYEEALSLGGQPDAERRALVEELGDALASAGRGARAADAYNQAAVGAPAANALDLRRRAADQLLRSGHIDAGIDAIASVLGSIGASLPSSPLAALASIFFWRVWVLLRGLDFVRRDESQIAAEELSRIDTFWSVAYGLGLVDSMRGMAFQARNLLMSLRAGEPFRAARAVAMEAAFSATGGQRAWPRTQRLIATAHALAEETKRPQAVGWAYATAGIAFYMSGRFADALESMERSAEILSGECGVWWELDSARSFAVWSLAQLGRIRELREQQPPYLREALERGDLYASALFRGGDAVLGWLSSDDPDEALRQIDDAMGEWSNRAFHVEHFYEMIARTHVHLYAQRPREALDHVLSRWPGLTRSLLRRIEIIRIQSTQCRARAALACAEVDEAARPDLLREASRGGRALLRERAAWAKPQGQLLLAGVARLRGDASRATALTRNAVAGFEGVDLGLHAAVARSALAELVGGEEGKGPSASAEGWFREQGVVRPERFVAMLAPGLSRPSLAEAKAEQAEPKALAEEGGSVATR